MSTKFQTKPKFSVLGGDGPRKQPLLLRFEPMPGGWWSLRFKHEFLGETAEGDGWVMVEAQGASTHGALDQATKFLEAIYGPIEWLPYYDGSTIDDHI